MIALLIGAVVVLAGVAVILSLLLLVVFAYLQIKLLERIFFPDEISNPTATTTANPDTNQYTPIQEDQIPLDQFTPDFKKPTKLVFTDTGDSHGVAEVEEGDDI